MKRKSSTDSLCSALSLPVDNSFVSFRVVSCCLAQSKKAKLQSDACCDILRAAEYIFRNAVDEPLSGNEYGAFLRAGLVPRGRNFFVEEKK